MNIRDLLSRRTDLSTFIVHLTRDSTDSSGKENLLSIIRSGVIEARSAFGQAKSRVNGTPSENSQKAVCFTETPMEYINILTEDIDNRECRFSDYGIALPKRLARRRGINPVWYVDITPGHDWLTNPLNRLIEAAIATNNFPDQDISKITPFIEQMGTTAERRKEFWWEREWRHSGDFHLPDKFIAICPEEDFEDFRNNQELQQPIAYIDARWGLEEIIGRLAGFTSEEVSIPV